MRGLVPYGDLGRLVTAPMSTCESSLKAIPLSASQASLPRLSQSGLPRSARPPPVLGVALRERPGGRDPHHNRAVVVGECLAVCRAERVLDGLLGLERLGRRVGAVVAVVGHRALFSDKLGGVHGDVRRGRKGALPAHSENPSLWLRCLLKAPRSSGYRASMIRARAGAMPFLQPTCSSLRTMFTR